MLASVLRIVVSSPIYAMLSSNSAKKFSGWVRRYFQPYHSLRTIPYPIPPTTTKHPLNRRAPASTLHAERSPHISLVLLDLTKIVLSAPLGKLESIRGLACYIHHGDEKELQSVQTLLQPKGPRKATRCDSGGKKREIGLEPCRDRKIPGRNPAI